MGTRRSPHAALGQAINQRHCCSWCRALATSNLGSWALSAEVEIGMKPSEKSARALEGVGLTPEQKYESHRQEFNRSSGLAVSRVLDMLQKKIVDQSIEINACVEALKAANLLQKDFAGNELQEILDIPMAKHTLELRDALEKLPEHIKARLQG